VATKLRAVGPDEKPLRALSAVEAAEADDRLAELRAMRRRIATALDDANTPARDLAALSRRQIEIGRDIEALLLRDAEEARSGVVTDEEFDAEAI
jgi:D-serine deaminase-like pyridoxal phosphate-dependent protein